MRFYDIIEKKRDGGELTESEIRWFVDEYTSGRAPDYQASALLMAIYLRGMTDAETAVLTDAMCRSGDTLDLSRFGALAVDKHSTGGVGDKTTLIVAPLAAALGLKVAKMSGRGLGHTGGTVDKLESIPGYRTALPADEFMAQVERIGVAVIGQSGNLVPADKKLYALRDVTATVSSIPLIASSIMSKKLAAGAGSIVLDVKVGSGAFMHTPQEAEKLARTMVEIGARCSRKVSALLTNMDLPLGRAVGNALEVREAVEMLRGETNSDAALREICVALAGQMAALALGIDHTEATNRARRALESGAALAKFREWISAQGGDCGFIDRPETLCPASRRETVTAPRAGWVHSVDAAGIGKAAMLLGAGRERKEDGIDFSAGVLLCVKNGERVEAGAPLCELLSSTVEDFSGAAETAAAAFVISDEPAPEQRLIYGIVQA